MTTQITYTALAGFPLVQPDDDLVDLIASGVRLSKLSVADGDIFVLAQKIVSKSEGRFVDLANVTPSPRALELAKVVGKDPRHIEVVLSESKDVVRTRQNVMIVEHRLGFVMANAGIDESNIEHAPGKARVLLLPENPDASCARLKQGLDHVFGCSVGVLMNDSFGRPWRNGVVGVAIGSAGIPSLHNMIGAPDLFDRAMQVTEVAIADELAAAASLVMGQGDEGQPVVHISGFRSPAAVSPVATLIRPKEKDMFR